MTDKDLGLCEFEKAKDEYSPLGMTLNEAFEKDEVKSVAKSKSDFNCDSNHTFFELYKKTDEFKDMPRGSKYRIKKNVNKRLNKFKNVKPIKSETRLKNERIIKNVGEVYSKYYYVYKGEHDNGGELNGVENKYFDYKQFKIVNKRDKESKLDKETKHFLKEIEKREKSVHKKEFMGYFNYEPSALVNKLSSQNTQDLKKSFDEMK